MLKLFFLLFFFLFFNLKMFAFDTRSCVLTPLKDELILKDWPFGLWPQRLSISKQRCLVEITSKRFTEKKWTVDLCREPVHLRVSSWSGEEVLFLPKKSCSQAKEPYCHEVDELTQMMEHVALIFAQGEREQLQSSHGKFYCAHLLLQKYLQQHHFFEMNYPEAVLLFPREEAVVPVPTPIPVTTTTPEVKASAPAAVVAPAKSTDGF